MIDKKFLTAGKAIFTVEVPERFRTFNKTKTHYTFRIKLRPAGNGYGEKLFVGLLTGPDNTKHYGYLGVLDLPFGKVRLTSGSKFSEDSWPVKIVRSVVARIWADEGDMIEASGWHVHHEGRCGRCMAPLTVPASIQSGFGPECVKVVNKTVAA